MIKVHYIESASRLLEQVRHRGNAVEQEKLNGLQFSDLIPRERG